MGITESYNPNACSIGGMNNGLQNWSWDEYRGKKEQLGDKIILVDMINHPIPDSVPISNELFEPGNKPEGTIFALYCHSGGSSGYIGMQLTNQLPMYNFVNISGGIMSY